MRPPGFYLATAMLGLVLLAPIISVGTGAVAQLTGSQLLQKVAQETGGGSGCVLATGELDGSNDPLPLDENGKRVDCTMEAVERIFNPDKPVNPLCPQ